MSSITKFKEKYFRSAEFRFKGMYVYCGQGTDLKGKIKNLDFVLKNLNHGHGINNIEILYTSPMYMPINRCDKYCLEHDCYYHMSEKFSSGIRKKLEHEADTLLIDRLEKLKANLSPYCNECIDCSIVIGIMKLKMKIDDEEVCCVLA